MTNENLPLNSKSKRWTLASLNLLVTLIIIVILGQLFPYTGLRAIIVIPFILIVVLILNLGAIRLSKNQLQSKFLLTWTFCILFTQYFIIRNYPQEFRPNPIRQLINIKTAIDSYEELTLADLDLPFTLVDFGRLDCETIDSQERYVVALYKFRNQIPLDGSFNIYREDKANSVVNKFTQVTKIDSIPLMLQTGQEKLIWRLLDK